MTTAPSIYAFGNYRAYLAAFLDAKKAGGESFRQVAKACGITSPNYFQQVIARKRNMTVATAVKVAAGFALDERARKYFVALVQFEHDPGADKEQILEKLRLYAKEQGRKSVRDVAIHSSWLHGVVWELARTEGFVFTLENVQARLGHIASKKDIEESMAFLKKQKWLVPSDVPGVMKQNEIHFEILDDVRRIDLQRTHLRFLEIAKHRISDDLDDREYRYLTIAVPRSKFPVIKQKIRDFHAEIWKELDGASPPETVVHLQICLFKLSTDPSD
jgi:uncharacterized protein (TIGR02147 family)